MNAEGSPDADDPLLGRTLAGAYRLEAVLGRGAMGVVYRARHVLMGDDFAVKVIHEDLAAEEDVRSRFVQEARALTRLNHRHIVQIRHCGEEQGRLFLAMDLCEGESLRDLLEREGALAPERAAAILDQVLDALDAAHQARVVHRDLKPDNIMVARDGGVERVRVLDFGLARLLLPPGEALPGALETIAGRVVGTVAYMSPEQVRASSEVDARSDLFAAGVVLYEMLSGGLPFASDSAFSVMMRIIEQPPAPLPVTNALPPHLREVIARALEKDVDRRFQTAAAFREALGGGTLPPLPPPRPEVPTDGAGRGSRRLAWGAGIGLGAALVVAALALTGVFEGDGPEALRRQAAAAAAGCAPREAARLYARLRAQGAATGEDHLRAAIARIEAGDKNAVEDLNDAQFLLGSEPAVFVAWGRFHGLMGDADKAFEAFGDALVREPGYRDALVWRLRVALAPGMDARPDAGARLAMAERDLETLERHAPDDPELPVARSRLLRIQAAAQPEAAERDRLLEGALAAAEEAAARETRAALPCLEIGAVQLLRGHHAQAAGAYDVAEARWREGIAALTTGLARIEAYPHHECQGDRRGDLLQVRSACLFHVGDVQAVAADLEELGRLQESPESIMSVAISLRNAGRLREAMKLYGILIDATQGQSAYFDLAFCHQQLGRTSAMAGERAEAYEDFTQALTTYTKALSVFGESPTFLAYRAETYMLRAEVAAEGPEADLAAAGSDFDRALALEGSRPTPSDEVAFRYTAFLSRTGQVDRAREVMTAVIGDRKNMNPSYYGNHARILIASAARAPAQAAGYLDLASAQLDRVDAMHPASRPAVHYLQGLVALVRGDRDAAARLFDEAEIEARDERPWLATTARLAAAEVGLPGAQDVLRHRLDELASGRWEHSGAHYRLLAEALAAAGRTEEAALARGRADALGP